MNELLSSIGSLPMVMKLGAFAGIALVTHALVIVVRRLAAHMLSVKSHRRYQKLKSIGTLATSALVFTLYFLAFGFILQELGVSLTAYLASASVAGLAIGFGSQGVVQDVVTGLTFIFSDLVDVGDLVEISGQTGIVKAITMRFVELENALGASVFIPNRTINNVINYPRGYVRCLVDVALTGDPDTRDKIESTALTLMETVSEQFPGIMIRTPSRESRVALRTGKEIVRLKFRIWPNRGAAIESAFNQELVARLKIDVPDFQAWMVSISYEVEERIAKSAGNWSWLDRK